MSKGWDWRQPVGHDQQPRLEWWVEQIAVVTLIRIAKRAHRRGDRQTLTRVFAICKAGADAERGR